MAVFRENFFNDAVREAKGRATTSFAKKDFHGRFSLEVWTPESRRSRAVILSDQLIFRWQNAMSTLLLLVEKLVKWATRSQQKKRRVYASPDFTFSTNQSASFFLLH